MDFETRKLQLPHLITEAYFAGQGDPGSIFTPGGLQGAGDFGRYSGLGESFASIGLFVTWARRFASVAAGPFCLQSLETNAFDLLHVMDAFEMAKPNLVGSSFGTSTSLTFAFWMPKRVNKLVLLYPAQMQSPSEDLDRIGRIKRLKEQVLNQGVAGALESGDFCYSFSPDRPDLAGGRVGDMDPEEFGILIEETFRRMGTARLPVLGMPASMMRQIEHPALVVSGNDETHSPEAAHAVADCLPNARLSDAVRKDKSTLEPELLEEIIAFLQE